MIYRLENIVYRYNIKPVLEINALEFTQGQMHALVGHNGAGKTSLLMLLAFLTAPSSGRLEFMGQTVENSEKIRRQLRQDVVLIPQHPIMFSTSVRANIEFGLKIRKIGRTQRDKTVDKVLDMVGLPQYKFSKAHELSGGETQRIALARGLALSPRVLLCDEPTASVDTTNQRVIADLLHHINAEQGTTIIFTTHHRDQVMNMAHNIVSLENGRCAQSKAASLKQTPIDS